MFSSDSNPPAPGMKRVVLRPPRTTYFPGAFFMRGAGCSRPRGVVFLRHCKRAAFPTWVRPDDGREGPAASRSSIVRGV